GFSMVTSYFLSSTFVPVMSVWLLRHYHPRTDAKPGRFSFARMRDRYAGVLKRLVPLRWPILTAYLVVAGLLVGWWIVGHWRVGTEIFPSVDAGQFQVRLRAPTGTRIERTEEMTLRALDAIKDAVGPDNVAISIAYVGVVPGNYPINSVYLWMSGPEEAVLLVSLKPGSGARLEELKERLRGDLIVRRGEWLQQRLRGDGLSEDVIAQRVKGLRMSFEPADIVNQVMSFGAPTPVEIAVSSTDLAANREYAEKIREQLTGIPSLRDLQ